MTTAPGRPSSPAAMRGMAVAVGLGVDRLVGDPSDRWHPVAWFGTTMGALERWWWRDSRGNGVAHTVVGVTGAWAAAAVATRAWAPAPVAVAATAVTVGARSLGRSAGGIGDALDGGDLAEARRLLPTLVGRDPTQLDGAEITRAVVESVAENTVDAVVAPVLWCLLAGAPAAAAYRAANTLDAMVGHHSPRYERFGWASARLDDVANFVPARVTAALVAAVRPRRAGAVWRAVRDDAPAHPSPNAGVAEAAFAAALGLRLGGTNVYGGRSEVRPTLGTGRLPDAGDIARARRLADHVTAALAVATVLPAVVVAITRRSRR